MTTDRYYYYASAHLNQIGEFVDRRLSAFSERHKIAIPIPSLTAAQDPVSSALQDRPQGVVIEMLYGWPTRTHLRATRRLLAEGIPTFFYWPNEAAIERIDTERLGSYWHLWTVVHTVYASSRLKARLRPYYHLVRSMARRFRPMPAVGVAAWSEPGIHEAQAHSDVAAMVRREADQIVADAAPVPLTSLDRREPGRLRVKGTGVYLRTDFWAQIQSGGSYGHTCYVADALSDVTDRLVCFMASRFALLDEMGLDQIVLDPPGAEAVESNFLRATGHYVTQLRAAFQALRPAYVYERLCIGNYVGAKLCHELGIPYLVEYNGSEISMSKSFGGSGFVYEDTYIEIEEAAFRQASAVSVVSQVVKDALLKRGIDETKILVNPNGVDIDAYAPATPTEKSELRAELGFSSSDRVIGFIGTFGGWHGVDVLAAALPRVCERASNARFLLIGDGSLKHVVDEQILKNGLGDRVRTMGAVPQKEGARLLRACDIYVSPHNAHMVDSRFFGSPTKIFEYMAMGGGIVASDLEQIGEVLSPALRADALTSDLGARLTDARSVLCEPGNVDQFIDSVVFLCDHAEVCEQLGRNARRAAAMHYTWNRHVANLLHFVHARYEHAAVPAVVALTAQTMQQQAVAVGAAGGGAQSRSAVATLVSADERRHMATGDAYKDQVQNQWDNNPCGSQYAREAQPHTLEWFLNVERHRYEEYGPWMPETMEFASHGGKELLEIGAGLGTDLAQFARHGAIVTDVDLSSGHLALARENFKLRGLIGRFVHHDAETLPFPDESFDVVYSNGVIHHTPNTQALIDEIYRVLRPGGKAIIMVYAENSLYYWRNLVGWLGLRKGMLMSSSIGHVMSCSVEMNENEARPLVKVYTKARLRQMFGRFADVSIVKRQITAPEIPKSLSWLGLDLAGRLMGWNLVVKAFKPR